MQIKAWGKNVMDFVTRNSSTILTSVATAGVITTAIFAGDGTVKAYKIIADRGDVTLEDDVWVSDKPSTKEVVLLTWRCYIPAIVMGGLTIGCIIGANHISLRRNAALASVYSITETALKEYQDKVVETIGPNKEMKIRDEVAADKVKESPPGGKNEVILTGKGEVLCMDGYTGGYFRSDIEKVRQAINEFNRNLMSDMFLSLNDFYDYLGLKHSPMGDDLGWDIDKGLLDVKFSSCLTEAGEPCLVLNYSVRPKYMT